MENDLSFYNGRKYLGPLDRAIISSQKSKIEFAKTMMLISYIEEIQEIEKLLQSDNLLSYEKKIYEIALEIKEQELHKFLGLPNDRQDKNDKLSKT